MNTETIHLSSTDFDNLLWCATRYCIGRHSYVSSYAQDFWRIIQSNRNLLREDRLGFFARDIRTSVSKCIGYYDNVQVERAYNDCIQFDALTLLASYARLHPELMEQDTFYEVDCIGGRVDASPWEGKNKRPHAIPFQICNEVDLPYWVMLANCIDRQYEVKLKCDDGERIERCVKHPVNDEYVVVNNWSSCVCKEFIVDVKPMF